MKTETATVIIFLFSTLVITLFIIAEHQMGELKEVAYELDSIKKASRKTEEDLLQCADCCNQMNIRMSEWYVRKDSIVYDFYIKLNTKMNK